jgi:soluble lytic murein transglycosylase-like protein
VAALLSASPASGDNISRWKSEVAEAAKRTGLPAQWIVRVIKAESGGRTEKLGVPIVSRRGAMGLMQLMPGTWLEMRAELALGDDPFDAHDNIIAGSFYLRKMYDRFGYPGLFAAYNAGPGSYTEHLATGRPLARETRSYLAKVTEASTLAEARLAAPRKAVPLFVALGSRSKRKVPVTAARDRLFVPLTYPPVVPDRPEVGRSRGTERPRTEAAPQSD